MKSRRWRAIAKAERYLKQQEFGFNPNIQIVDELSIPVKSAVTRFVGHISGAGVTVTNEFKRYLDKIIEPNSQSTFEQLDHSAPLNVFPVPKAWFSKIENALGIKLTAFQKSKLYNPDGHYYGGRGMRRAAVHCILLALSIGPPLTIKAAANYAECAATDRNSLFYELYKVIAEKLEGAGFSVRQVGDVGGWKLHY